jgi:hypothetical protein
MPMKHDFFPVFEYGAKKHAFSVLYMKKKHIFIGFLNNIRFLTSLPQPA